MVRLGHLRSSALGGGGIIGLWQEHGDQLNGSILMAGAFRPEPTKMWKPVRSALGVELAHPWKPKMREYLVSKAIVRSTNVDALMDLLEAQAAQCPLPIVTMFDWLWYQQPGRS